MQTFNVYPKKGEMFTLQCHHFEFDGQQFILYEYADEPSKDGFLSRGHIAAVVAQDLTKPYDYSDARNFHIHLKNRKEPLEIPAHSFKIQPPNVKFYWNPVDPETGLVLDKEIKDVYIALSEVVCVTPSDGVRYRG
jgi:hypothetical protein